MGSKWLTADDRDRIENYLSKPAHERRIEDLVPDDDVPDRP